MSETTSFSNKLKRWTIIILSVVLLVLLLVLVLNFKNLSFFGKSVQEKFTGIETTLQTYDDDGQALDKMVGKSVAIDADKQFSLYNEDGDEIKKSQVLKITVGGHEAIHVGSSLIAYEKGLDNILDEYSETITIDNTNRTVPFVNKFVNDMKNRFQGMDKVVLIRSQSGKPIATFAGNKVVFKETEIEKSTALLIDGKLLFIYRSDYSIYDRALLEQ
ncbi:DUF5052 family protein [Savagea sp. SN6]|uniref:DUF5052 family protein n=1 Tax=Savagea serpentis TaxID=2785297 RepID=A0A8J7KDW4_9BACL|nr:DUF5052 family protein [Savagea serpentis]MBF4500531.1 DUF5052 family protein [Savagea serpentis]